MEKGWKIGLQKYERSTEEGKSGGDKGNVERVKIVLTKRWKVGLNVGWNKHCKQSENLVDEKVKGVLKEG